MNTKKSQVSSTNQGWEGERQEEITVMVKGGGGGGGKFTLTIKPQLGVFNQF